MPAVFTVRGVPTLDPKEQVALEKRPCLSEASHDHIQSAQGGKDLGENVFWDDNAKPRRIWR